MLNTFVVSLTERIDRFQDLHKHRTVSKRSVLPSTIGQPEALGKHIVNEPYDYHVRISFDDVVRECRIVFQFVKSHNFHLRRMDYSALFKS